jgi:hypothetical protein
MKPSRIPNPETLVAGLHLLQGSMHDRQREDKLTLVGPH